VFPQFSYTVFHYYIASLKEPVSISFYAPSVSDGTDTPGRAKSKYAKLPSIADGRIDREEGPGETVEPHLGHGKGTVMELRNGRGAPERTPNSRPPRCSADPGHPVGRRRTSPTGCNSQWTCLDHPLRRLCDRGGVDEGLGTT